MQKSLQRIEISKELSSHIKMTIVSTIAICLATVLALLLCHSIYIDNLRPEAINGWVARDKDGALYLFQNKPVRYATIWLDCNQPIGESMMLSEDSFPSLTWKDEPIEVEITVKLKKR